MKEPDDRLRRCFLKASSMLGLAVAFTSAPIGEAFADSKSATAQTENATTQTRATPAADKTTIRPLRAKLDGAAYHKLIHYNQADRGGTMRRGNSRNSFRKRFASFRSLR
jgi:hypothetical protein